MAMEPASSSCCRRTFFALLFASLAIIVQLLCFVFEDVVVVVVIVAVAVVVSVVSLGTVVEFVDIPLSLDIVTVIGVVAEISGIKVGSSGAIAKFRSVLRIPAKHGIIMAILNTATIITELPAVDDNMLQYIFSLERYNSDLQ